jgi:xanthosine utilization system XapX-like protein
MTGRNLIILALGALVVAVRADTPPSLAIVGIAGAAGAGNQAIPAASIAKPGSAPAGNGATPSGDISAALSADAAESDKRVPGAAEPFKTPSLPPVGAAIGETPQFLVGALPAYLVLGSRVFAIRNGELYTKAGMTAQSFKDHPGLAVGNVFNLNADRAREMYREEDWRNTKSDYRDMAHAMALGGDPGEGKMIVNAIRDEDLQMRAEAGNDGAISTMDRFQPSQAQSNTRFVSGPENPIDFPVVRLIW